MRNTKRNSLDSRKRGIIVKWLIDRWTKKWETYLKITPILNTSYKNSNPSYRSLLRTSYHSRNNLRSVIGIWLLERIKLGNWNSMYYDLIFNLVISKLNHFRAHWLIHWIKKIYSLTREDQILKQLRVRCRYRCYNQENLRLKVQYRVTTQINGIKIKTTMNNSTKEVLMIRVLIRLILVALKSLAKI